MGRPATVQEAVQAVQDAVGRAGTVPVTGFVLEDLLALCSDGTEQLERVLLELRQTGLAMVAEVSAESLSEPYPIFSALQASGVGVARLTVNSPPGVIAQEVLRRVALWDGVGAVCRSFAPLPRVESYLPSTGYSDLRQVALARLLVDNIESIQVDWSSYGPKLSQVAVTFGADDVDAVTSAGHDERGWRRSPGEEIRRNIIAAGFTPMPRDGCFKAVKS